MLTLLYNGHEPERGFRVRVSRRPPFAFAATTEASDGSITALDHEERTFPDLETALQGWRTYISWVKDSLPENVELESYAMVHSDSGDTLAVRSETVDYWDVELKLPPSEDDDTGGEVEVMIELINLDDVQNHSMFCAVESMLKDITNG